MAILIGTNLIPPITWQNTSTSVQATKNIFLKKWLQARMQTVPRSLPQETFSTFNTKTAKTHFETKTLQLTKIALRAKQLASKIWKPKSVIFVFLVVGMYFNARQNCQQVIRDHTAQIAAKKGFNFHQITTKVQIICWIIVTPLLRSTGSPNRGNSSSTSTKNRILSVLGKRLQCLILVTSQNTKRVPSTILCPLKRRNKLRGPLETKLSIY